MKKIALSPETFERLRRSGLTVDALPRFIDGVEVEYVPPPSNLPETMTAAEIARAAIERWYRTSSCPSPAVANKATHDALHALNQLNRAFWEGGTR